MIPGFGKLVGPKSSGKGARENIYDIAIICVLLSIEVLSHRVEQLAALLRLVTPQEPPMEPSRAAFLMSTGAGEGEGEGEGEGKGERERERGREGE